MDYNKVIYKKQEFNLNAVLSFDLLKEILYKLLISQGNLEKEIDQIKISNIKRDSDISKIEKIIKDNLVFDEDFSGAVNNSYFSQKENEEEEVENENSQQNEEENLPSVNQQNQEEIKEEEKVVNNENEEEKKEIKEIKEIKPKEEIIKEDEIQLNEEKKETEIKEIKNENEKEIILEKNKEMNTEKNQEDKKEDIKEEPIEEKKEEKIVEKEEHKNEPEKKEENKPIEEADKNQEIKEIMEIKEEQKIKPEIKKIPVKTSKRENKVHVSKKKKKSIQKEQIEETSNQNNNNNNVTIQSNSNNQIPTELISKMAKQIKDNKRQILDLEKRLMKEILLKTDSCKKEVRNVINVNNKENQSKFNDLEGKFMEMMELKEKLENQMEDCVTKCSTIDVFNMFKDSGDGTVDAAKVMVRSLEEKVFKKIEYIDTRAKKDQNNNSEMKNSVEGLIKTINNMNKEIQDLNENVDKNKENVSDIKNDFDEYKKNVDEFIKNNTGLKKEIEKIKKEEKNLKDNIKELEEKIKELKDNNINNNEQGVNSMFKLGFDNKVVDEEVIQSLEKKIGDLRKKMNDLENTLKLKIQDLEEKQYETRNLKAILEKKITREDLKELYNLHLNDLDEINDLKDNINVTFDDIRKIKENQTNIYQKLDNLNRNVSLLQSIKKNGTVTPGIINFDKYIEEQKFNETIKPIISNIDKIYKEIASLERNHSELESFAKMLVKPERVNKVEDDLNAKISEMKVIFGKRFVEKSELSKNIKQLELQIKSLDFENKKNDAETWLMAKQPVGCFNCASCEANIKNVNPSNEYLPWNKYPQQDKIYRMGKGFSHMLQMMTSEFVKSIGNAQKDNENEFTPKNGINPNFVLDKNTFNRSEKNNLNKNERKQSASVLKINNKEQFNEEALKKINFNLYSSRIKGKMQLPRVIKFKKKVKIRNENGIPVSDDEISRRNDTAEREGFNDKTSPKIMKIMKKKQYLKTEENVDLTETNNSKF